MCAPTHAAPDRTGVQNLVGMSQCRCRSCSCRCSRPLSACARAQLTLAAGMLSTWKIIWSITPLWLANACGACVHLYTSRSTGKPKGVDHTLCGYMIGTATTAGLKCKPYNLAARARSCTPAGPQASPRAWSTRWAATWSARPPRSSTCSITTSATCTGAPPTAAGSRGTPTSPMARPTCSRVWPTGCMALRHCAHLTPAQSSPGSNRLMHAHAHGAAMPHCCARMGSVQKPRGPC